MSALRDKILAFVKECADDFEGLPEYLQPKQSDRSKRHPKVRYSGPVWDEREIAAAIESLIAGKWVSAGEKVQLFERRFAKAIGAKHAVMVNSGSSANLAMMSALKRRFQWRDGDEVVISSVGFPTTLNPILQCGLSPAFVDIDFGDLNWNLDELESKIGPRTVAVFSSPVLGNPYDLDRVSALCAERSLQLIGDNCDSLGTKWRGKPIGQSFVASSYSFYPAHHITTGEGGMVCTNDAEIAATVRSLAWWGRDCYCVGTANLLPNGTCGERFKPWLADDYDGVVDHKYLFTNVGYNLKPLDLQGAIGLVQLEKLESICAARRRNKAIMEDIFRTIPNVEIPTEREHAETSWFGVPIICSSGAIKQQIVRHLESNGIQTRNYFAGNILLHPAYRELGNFRDFPNANLVLERVFFVGCSPNLDDMAFEHIRKTVQELELA